MKNMTYTFVPDLQPVRVNAPGSIVHQRRALAVGYLGSDALITGPVPAEVVHALRHFAHANTVRGDEYFPCGVCRDVSSPDEFWIESAYALYVLPCTVDHAIHVHGYCPPSQFIRDITAVWRDMSSAIRDAKCPPPVLEERKDPAHDPELRVLKKKMGLL